MEKNNYKIKITYATAEIDEDTYDNGEGAYVGDFNYDDWVGATFDDVQQLLDFINARSYEVFTSEIYDYVFHDGALQSDAQIDEENEPATDEEWELWKDGKIKLYVAHLTVLLEMFDIHEMTEDEAEELGFEIF